MLDTSPVYFVTRESRCFPVFSEIGPPIPAWHGWTNCPDKKTNNKDFYRKPLNFLFSNISEKLLKYRYVLVFVVHCV